MHDRLPRWVRNPDPCTPQLYAYTIVSWVLVVFAGESDTAMVRELDTLVEAAAAGTGWFVGHTDAAPFVAAERDRVVEMIRRDRAARLARVGVMGGTLEIGPRRVKLPTRLAAAGCLVCGHDPHSEDCPVPGARAAFDALHVAMTDDDERTPCHACDEPNAHFEEVDGSCGGSGTLQCICGGDFCICHNHGEVDCPGCEDCDGNGDFDDDDFDDD